MEKIYEFLIQSMNQGKIERQTAIEFIKRLKDKKIHYIEDIAVIGLALKFPGSENAESFWDNLSKGCDCIGEFPDSRKQDILPLIHNGHGALDVGAYLKEIDQFDYDLFKLAPKEASLMDPNQRLFLEIAWQTLEDAGYGGERLKGKNVGVFVGYSSDFGISYQKIIDLGRETNGMELPGNIKSIIASRISYILDLHGPSMLIDTACSSSLMAVHLACQSIYNGDCELALAGGVKINLIPLKGGDRVGIQSLDGKTRTFDEDANGTGLGEGVAAVLLKPVKKALADNDLIYAVIKGSANNQDGASIGITAPNPNAQSKLLLKVWENAQVQAETISYIEAHGTGTKLGDPIEVEAIDMAFRKHSPKKQFCAIGSLKTNIGHLDNAAGIAGFIKAVLALKHKEIPPSLHFQRPNRKINFVDSPVYINDQLRKWENDGHPRRCGVSAFGLSGTNCHVLLEEAPERKITDECQPGIFLITLSAQYRSGIIKLVEEYRGLICQQTTLNLNDLCFTANTGRGHYSHRLIMMFSDIIDLHDKLEKVITAETLESAKIKDVYYGWYKITTSNKEERVEGEYTENEIRTINNSVNVKIKDVTKENPIKDKGLLEEICLAYIQGADIDWPEVYKDKKYHKLSLPGYPFQKKRCWVEYTVGTAVETMGLSQLTEERDRFYNVVWVPYDLIPEAITPKKGSILVLKGQTEFAGTMIQALKKQGKEIIEVSLGEAYCQVDHATFIIDNTENSYTKLIASLKGYNLGRLIHLQTLSNHQEISNIHQLEESQQKGVYSLFYLTRALLAKGIKAELDIVLIAANVHEVTGAEKTLNPYPASLFGLGKVIIQEYSNLHCRCIDIDVNTGMNEILLELEHGTGVYQVAYRNGRRFVEELHEIGIDHFPSREIPIHSEGVYLITGGTGGLGLEFGKYLAVKNSRAHARVKLSLFTRSGIPERKTWNEIIAKNEDQRLMKKIRAIQEMEQSGAEVSCYSVDVSNEEALKGALAELRRKYGRINGIIHGAGVAGAGLIIHKEERVFQGVLAPKIQGTWLMDKYTENDDLDFFILFSSITSLFGEPGQGDYTAANDFLDAYAHQRNKKGKKTVSINWPAWKETGMAFDYGANTDGIFQTISTESALQSFDQILKKNLVTIIPGRLNDDFLENNSCTVNWSKGVKDKIAETRLLKSNRMLANQNINLAPARMVKLNGRASGIYSDTEMEIASIWGKLLGRDEIDIYNDFTELGGNSIVAVQFEYEMELRGFKVYYSDVNTYKTVKDLAAYIERTANHQEESAIAEKRVKIINHGPQSVAKGVPVRDPLENIQPYNDVFYKWCFYNSLFPVLIAFNKDILPFLVNDIILYSENIDHQWRGSNIWYHSVKPFPQMMEENGISIETKTHRVDKKENIAKIDQDGIFQLAQDIGLGVDRNEPIANLQENLMKSLGNQNPVIIFLDSYYESIRFDTYQKIHWPHTLLIYGFDAENQVFKIIEHSYRNNLTYKPQAIGFEDLISSYRGFIDCFQINGSMPTYLEFKGPGLNQAQSNNIPDHRQLVGIYKRNLLQKREDLLDGIESLQRITAEMNQILSDEVVLRDLAEKLLSNLNEIINSKDIEKYKIIKLLNHEESLIEIIERIREGWVSIRNLVVKYIYTSEYDGEKFGMMADKFEEIQVCEGEYLKKLFRFMESISNPEI